MSRVLIALALLAVSAPSSALEKAPARAPHGSPPLDTQWRSSCTKTIDYFNTCTGWVWLWDDVPPGARIGVNFDVDYCFLGDVYWCEVQGTYMLFDQGAIPGYGYTGTVMLAEAGGPDGCPSTVLESQPFLPATGWNSLVWTSGPMPPGRYAVIWENGPGANGTVSFVTEWPSAGPSGPPACGTCYSPAREPHSFFWGTAGSPLCPGEPLRDGACTAELLWCSYGILDFEAADVPAAVPAAAPDLEASSWSRIKSFYR